MRKVITGTICVIAAITLSACGSSNTGSAKPSASKTDLATTALKQELIKQSSTTTAGPLKFDAAQAGCVATKVVSAVGADNLRDYGLLSSTYQTTSKTLDDVEMSKADATSVVNAFIGCLGESTFTQYLADAVTSSIPGANTTTQRTCLQDKLTVVALKPMLISTLSGDKQAATNFYAGLLKCAKR